MTAAPHTPVMVDRVVEVLAPADDKVYVDATFGAGGYSRALLAAAGCSVWGLDRDPDAIHAGRDLAAGYQGRLRLLPGAFADMQPLLHEQGVYHVDGVAMDLGVSSMQLDQAERGFSFRHDGPLDMRMERHGETAADLVNERPESDLADLIHHLGEERHARRIAKAIGRARAEAPITTTGRLAEVVRGCVKPAKDGIDPATRTFQALRIAVNDELGQLERGLEAAESLLAPGGRLAVVAFHSLEDRIVKDFLRRRSGNTPKPSRHQPDTADREPAPSFRLLKRGAIKPTEAEVAANPRARSARLRAAERTDAPAWPADDRRAA